MLLLNTLRCHPPLTRAARGNRRTKDTTTNRTVIMIPACRSIARTTTFRTLGRRNYANVGDGALGEAFLKEREAVRHHAAKSSELWRKITYYVGIPSIGLALLNAYNLAKEHEHHLEHIKEENGGELPERIQYDYLNHQVKPFPWGTRTLFHNPKTNLPPPE